MKKNLIVIVMFFALISLVGCGKANDSATSTPQKITASEAKEMMDKDANVVILDVRTLDEYNEGHIDKSILIPDTEIKDQAETTLTDKSATILVYCRSGRRSALASATLVELGYTNVYDFGGIIDWTYAIVK